MVVGVARAEPVRLFFGGNRAPAFSTPHHPGIGEHAGLAGHAGPSEQRLDPFKVVRRNHGPMLARKTLASRLDDSGIKRIGEDLVNTTQTDWLSAHPFPFWRPKAPVIRCDLPDASWWIPYFTISCKNGNRITKNV